MQRPRGWDSHGGGRRLGRCSGKSTVRTRYTVFRVAGRRKGGDAMSLGLRQDGTDSWERKRAGGIIVVTPFGLRSTCSYVQETEVTGEGNAGSSTEQGGTEYCRYGKMKQAGFRDPEHSS